MLDLPPRHPFPSEPQGGFEGGLGSYRPAFFQPLGFSVHQSQLTPLTAPHEPWSPSREVSVIVTSPAPSLLDLNSYPQQFGPS